MIFRKPAKRLQRFKMATAFGHKFDDVPDQNLTLHEMFRVVGDQLLPRDVRVLKFLYTGVFPDDLRAKIHDGYTFFLALERIGRVDTSNFKYIINVLRILVRQDLIPLVTLRRRKTVEPDPVDLYLEETARISSGKRKFSVTEPDSEPSTSRSDPTPSPSPSLPTPSPHATPSPQCSSVHLGSPDAKRRRSARRRSAQTSTTTSPVTSATTSSATSSTSSVTSALGPTSTTAATGTVPTRSRENETVEHQEIRKKVTCDIRLRVRAEYCHHESALQGNVFSNKPELLERQFEKFMQANTILKSRDLGSIICDIKFSELTYLDAFWRDYINGSLLEALKGVFITESLKQAVGHEAIKLLVNVDEDDYEAGRKQLLRNLQE